MLPNDPFDNIDRRYSYEGKIPLPPGVYAVHPTLLKYPIEEKAKTLMKSFNGKGIEEGIFTYSIGWVGNEEISRNEKYIGESVFNQNRKGKIIKPYAKENLREIYEIIDHKGLPNIPDDYTLSQKEAESIHSQMQQLIDSSLISENEISTWLQRSPLIQTDSKEKKEQYGYETGKVILNYVPYGVDFSEDTIEVRNLFSGKVELGPKFLPELDGDTSICSGKNLKSLPQLFYYLKSHGLGKDHLKMLGLYDEPIIREASKLKDNEEAWYYPYFEVPVTSNRQAIKRQKILYANRKNPLALNFKVDVLEHKFPFQSSGAIFYDSLYQDEVDMIYNDSYFHKDKKSRRNFKRDTKKIATIDIPMTLSEVRIYEPRKIPYPNTDYSEEANKWNPNLKFWAIVGGGAGALPGIWNGQPWVYLSTILCASAVAGGAYFWASWMNGTERDRIKRGWEKDIRNAERAREYEYEKRTKSVEEARKLITEMLEAPYRFYESLDVWNPKEPDENFYACIKEMESYCKRYSAETTTWGQGKVNPPDPKDSPYAWFFGQESTERARKIKEKQMNRKGHTGHPQANTRLENNLQAKYESLSELVSKGLIGENLRPELKKELVQMGKFFQGYFDIGEIYPSRERAPSEGSIESAMKESPLAACYRSDCKEFNGSP